MAFFTYIDMWECFGPDQQIPFLLMETIPGAKLTHSKSSFVERELYQKMRYEKKFEKAMVQ